MKSIKILVIDSEEIILKSIGKALRNCEENNYDIVTSTTALEGLKLIRSDKFDLVLIDLVIPGISTSELLRRIKNIDVEIPVVIMSGFPPTGIHSGKNRESEDELLKNASGFLLKPFTTEEVKSLITRVIMN